MEVAEAVEKIKRCLPPGVGADEVKALLERVPDCLPWIVDYFGGDCDYGLPSEAVPIVEGINNLARRIH